MLNDILEQIKQDALANNVPIIEDEGLQLLLSICDEYKPKKILEIGTAVGYSAINMYLHTNAHITSIERNQLMYETAIRNIDMCKLQAYITLINDDALLFDNSKIGKFDLIYIDAAKAQNKNFLDKYIENLSDNGIVVFDNLFFHGYVHKQLEQIESKNLRQLIRKLKDFNVFLNSTTDYHVKIYNEGDGIGVLKRKND